MGMDGLVREDLGLGEDLDGVVYEHDLLLSRPGRLLQRMILRTPLCGAWG